jgi:hypothetical protein
VLARPLFISAAVLLLSVTTVAGAQEPECAPSAKRAAILHEARLLLDEWRAEPDKAAYRRRMFDEGADWGVPLGGDHRSWGNRWGYHRNWCTAFARNVFRRGYAAAGEALPIDLCPATATVPECRKLLDTTSELNNQSQAEFSTMREAFERVGLFVVSSRTAPVVPGRGDMIFLDGGRYKRGHVAVVSWIERTGDAPAAWKAHLIEGNWEGAVAETENVTLGSSLVVGYGKAESADDAGATCAP